MHNRRMLFGVLLVAVTMLTACQSSGSSDSPAGVDADRQHLTLTVGQSTRVVLVSNRTTGFEWTISRAASTGMDLIRIENTGYVSTDSADGVVGAPGRQWWMIRGDKPGTAMIHLVYRRPWEEDTPPARRALITIDVSR